MKVERFHLFDAQETQELGRNLAARLVPGDLVLLSGPLGAGKTTLVQGLAQGLGIQDAVSSPTFVLMVEYPGAIPLLHLDAYRLEDADAEVLTDAGVFDFLDRPDAVKLVEWPEMLHGWLPSAKFQLILALADNGGRDVEIQEI